MLRITCIWLWSGASNLTWGASWMAGPMLLQKYSLCVALNAELIKGFFSETMSSETRITPWEPTKLCWSRWIKRPKSLHGSPWNSVDHAAEVTYWSGSSSLAKFITTFARISVLWFAFRWGWEKYAQDGCFYPVIQWKRFINTQMQYLLILGLKWIFSFQV